MNTNTILQITNLLTGIVSLVPLGLDMAQRIKAALEVDPNYTASIKYLTDDAIAANEEAIQSIEAADPEAAPKSAIPSAPSSALENPS